MFFTFKTETIGNVFVKMIEFDTESKKSFTWTGLFPCDIITAKLARKQVDILILYF